MVHNQKSKSIEILKKSLNEVVQEAVTILSNFLKEFDISLKVVRDLLDGINSDIKDKIKLNYRSTFYCHTL